MQYFPLEIFVIFGVILSIQDLKSHRLPNKLVFISSTLIFLLVITQSAQVMNSIRVAFIYIGIFLAFALISKGALGMGDVKYSLQCGLIIGFYAPKLWLFNIWIMFTCAALVGLTLIASKRATLASHLPFGPYMAISTTLLSLNSLLFG